MVEWLAVVFPAYALGCIPFGVLVARLFGNRGLTEQGSGNIGSANVLRTTGYAAAFCTLVLDAAKGAAAVSLVGADSPWQLPVVASVILGHMYPPWYRPGGKGVAVCLGITAMLAPLFVAFAAVFWAAVAAASNYASTASMAAAGLLVGLSYFIGDAQPHLQFSSALLMAFLVFWGHRHNIRRLLEGRELPLRGGR